MQRIREIKEHGYVRTVEIKVRGAAVGLKVYYRPKTKSSKENSTLSGKDMDRSSITQDNILDTVQAGNSTRAIVVIMPKLGEKSRKLRILRAGGNVRPPKRFWDRMIKIINKEYPNKSKTARARILGGIWNKYTIQDKIEIVKEFQ